MKGNTKGKQTVHQQVEKAKPNKRKRREPGFERCKPSTTVNVVHHPKRKPDSRATRKGKGCGEVVQYGGDGPWTTNDSEAKDREGRHSVECSQGVTVKTSSFRSREN